MIALFRFVIKVNLYSNDREAIHIAAVIASRGNKTTKSQAFTLNARVFLWEDFHNSYSYLSTCDGTGESVYKWIGN